jgi:hypothetical protein
MGTQADSVGARVHFASAKHRVELLPVEGLYERSRGASHG